MGDACSIDACLRDDGNGRPTNMAPRQSSKDGEPTTTTTTTVTDNANTTADEDDKKINELANTPYHSVSDPAEPNPQEISNDNEQDLSITDSDPEIVSSQRGNSRKMSDAVPYATDYSTDGIDELSDLGPISEEQSIPDDGDKNTNTGPGRPDVWLQKHKSRKLILPKHGSDVPICQECQGAFHIQDDPFNAYNGVGIVCDLCGENRENNPELIMQEYYYKCEACETVDICSNCYQNLKNEKKQSY